MTKMTYVGAIDFVLNTYGGMDDFNREAYDKLTALRDQIAKRASGERKPTAKQTTNEAVRAQIVAFINDNMSGDGFTCADLLKRVPGLEDKSNQYVSALMRQAVLAGEVSKGTVKRRTYFAPAGFYAAVAE